MTDILLIILIVIELANLFNKIEAKKPVKAKTKEQNKKEDERIKTIKSMIDYNMDQAIKSKKN